LVVVEELIHDTDGEVHLVNLRTTSGVIHKPIQKICPLEIYDEGIAKPVRTSAQVEQERTAIAVSQGKEGNGQNRAEVQTRCGRKVKLS